MALTLIKKIKARYKLWSRKRLFKEERVNSWYQYYRKNDVLINRRSGNIDGFYEGYKYVEVLDSYKVDKLFDIATEWCYNNCKGVYRHDIHRVIKQSGIKGDTVTEFYILNDLGGIDVVAFAFTNEQDYIWFKMKFL